MKGYIVVALAVVLALAPCAGWGVGREATRDHLRARKRFNRLAVRLLGSYYLLLAVDLVLSCVIRLATGAEVAQLQCLFWLLVLAGPALAIVMYARAARIRQTSFPNECPDCGYVVDPAFQRVCPECGNDPERRLRQEGGRGE